MQSQEWEVNILMYSIEMVKNKYIHSTENISKMICEKKIICYNDFVYYKNRYKILKSL